MVLCMQIRNIPDVCLMGKSVQNSSGSASVSRFKNTESDCYMASKPTFGHLTASAGNVVKIAKKAGSSRQAAARGIVKEILSLLKDGRRNIAELFEFKPRIATIAEDCYQQRLAGKLPPGNADSDWALAQLRVKDAEDLLKRHKFIPFKDRSERIKHIKTAKKLAARRITGKMKYGFHRSEIGLFPFLTAYREIVIGMVRDPHNTYLTGNALYNEVNKLAETRKIRLFLEKLVGKDADNQLRAMIRQAEGAVKDTLPEYREAHKRNALSILLGAPELPIRNSGGW